MAARLRASFSDRRLAALASLIGLSLLVAAMVAARVVYTRTGDGGALVWNLVLAWIPFVLALLVYDGYRNARRRSLLLGLSVLWLLFFPNAPYIVTDFKHLRSWHGSPVWFDALMITAAAWTGLLLGFISLYLMQSVVRRVFGAANAWAFAVAVIVLGSFGIYLGRFQRWNSWDVVARPDELLRAIGGRLLHPVAHPGMFAVTITFSAFLLAAYFVFYAFARLGAVGRSVDAPPHGLSPPATRPGGCWRRS